MKPLRRGGPLYRVIFCSIHKHSLVEVLEEHLVLLVEEIDVPKRVLLGRGREVEL